MKNIKILSLAFAIVAMSSQVNSRDTITYKDSKKIVQYDHTFIEGGLRYYGDDDIYYSVTEGLELTSDGNLEGCEVTKDFWNNTVSKKITKIEPILKLGTISYETWKTRDPRFPSNLILLNIGTVTIAVSALVYCFVIKNNKSSDVDSDNDQK